MFDKKLVQSIQEKIKFKIIAFTTHEVLKIIGIKKNYNNVLDYKKLNEIIESNKFREKYFNLTKDLDIKSIKVIDTILFRILHKKVFLPSRYLSKNEYQEIYKPYNYDNSFTNSEFNYPYFFYKKLYPGFSEYETSVFKFHHGLKIMDSKVKNFLEGKDFIDGGAFELDSAVVLLSNYPIRNVYSFEIDSSVIKKGNERISKYYPELLKKIKTINQGLWNSSGNATLNEGTAGTPSSNFNIKEPKSNTNSLTFPLETLDNFLNNEKEVNIGLIKLDVEGSEFNAIKGAEKTIQKFLPIMSISVYHNFKDFFEIKPLIEKMVPGKYNFYIRKLCPFIHPNETYLICIPKHLNIEVYNNFEDIDIYG